MVGGKSKQVCSPFPLWFCGGHNAVPKVEEEPIQVHATLHEHASDGNLQGVESLLAQRADVNMRTGQEDRAFAEATPLIVASRAGHESAVRRLLQEADVEVNAVTLNLDNSVRSGQTALHWAAREGRIAVAHLLMRDPRVAIDPKTKMGATPLWVANMGGNIEILESLIAKKADARVFLTAPNGDTFNTLQSALLEGQCESLRVLLTAGAYGIDDPVEFQLATHTPLGVSAKHNWIDRVKLLLALKADVDREVRGQRAFDLAYEGHAIEIAMNLLAHGCDTSHVLSKVRSAQIAGKAAQLAKLVQIRAVGPEDVVPELHLATLRNDVRALRAVLAKLQDPRSARYTLDGGKMPAVFYAIELGHLPTARLLMVEVHGLSEELAKVVLDAIREKSRGNSTGERMFRAIKALFGTTASEETQYAKGAAAMLQPWMGSVPALQFFRESEEEFHKLRAICHNRSQAIYDRIDAVVTRPVLQSLSNVGEKYLNNVARQDDLDILPKMEYFFNEEKRHPVGGNYEHYYAMDLAVLAMATDDLFVESMQNLLGPVSERVHTAPPKTFNRMRNKLINPNDHGDTTIPKPRPAKNLDVIRCAIEVSKPEDMQKVFSALESKYRILRTKNTHDPQESGFGGYRSTLVNFVFETDLTFGDVFGIGSFDCSLGLENGWLRKDETSNKWFNYIMQLPQKGDWSWALSALWFIARHEPERKVTLSAEVQIIYTPYLIGRSLSHLLFKISRAETGPDEMVRDFAPGFIDSSVLESSQEVRGISKEKRLSKRQEPQEEH